MSAQMNPDRIIMWVKNKALTVLLAVEVEEKQAR